jgi:hypothetical protein
MHQFQSPEIRRSAGPTTNADWLGWIWAMRARETNAKSNSLRMSTCLCLIDVQPPRSVDARGSEQLGLKLESKRAPVDVLIVDSCGVTVC